jgi:Ca2+-binding RTX toxin-like protein
MKRRHLFFLVLVIVGVLAFGANAALASIDFNPQTGEMFYSTSGTNLDNGDKVTVRHAESVGFTGWTKIEYQGWQFGQTSATANVAKYCFHEDYVLWACPATKVKVVGGHGPDTITVNSNVTIPTTLIGGRGSDVLTGGGGNDTIWGACTTPFDSQCYGYSDTLDGGNGNDTLHGGDETPVFGAAQDVLHGGNGDDTLDGGAGGDQLYGGLGKDTADYSARTQPILASLNDLGDDGEVNEHDNIHNDLEGIVGGSNSDILVGNDSANTLSGGPGNDTLRGKLGADVLQGGLGSDLVTYDERSNPVTANLDGVANDGEAGEQDNIGSDVENLTGGSGNDTLTGDYRGNTLIGGSGNDKLYGASMYAIGITWAPDNLYGNDGADLLYGGWAGSPGDYLDGSSGTDMVTYADRTSGVTINLADSNVGEDHIYGVENATGGSGDDTMIGNDGPNWFFAGGGVDTLSGNGGNDVLHGGDGNDTVDGGAGHDVVAGDKDNDLLIGGTGDDYISGHEGLDTVSYASYQVPVSVSLDGAYNDGAAGEGDNVLPDTEVVIGGEDDDTLSGDPVANWLYGGGGDDSLSGLGGNDILDGQAGTDALDGGADVDNCQGETVVNCENGGPSTTLSATPSSVAAGGSVTVSWSGVSSPTTTDWIGLYHPGDASDDQLGWITTSSCTQTAGATAKSSGSCSFKMPLTPGTYEFRLLANDGYTVLATYGSVTVG